MLPVLNVDKLTIVLIVYNEKSAEISVELIVQLKH